MKGVFHGYLFNGFTRLMAQMPYWIAPFGLGEWDDLALDDQLEERVLERHVGLHLGGSANSADMVVVGLVAGCGLCVLRLATGCGSEASLWVVECPDGASRFDPFVERPTQSWEGVIGHGSALREDLERGTVLAQLLCCPRLLCMQSPLTPYPIAYGVYVWGNTRSVHDFLSPLPFRPS